MELVQYSLEKATITALQQTYMDIEIPPDDKATYAMVMSGLVEFLQQADGWTSRSVEGVPKQT